MVKQGIYFLKDKLSYLAYRSTTPVVTRNSDLYIVEYPKSGITWLTSILANCCLIESGTSIRTTYYNLEQIIGDIHINRDIADNPIYPYYRFIKSHSPYNPFYRHVIYLLRNPYSVMKSYYHYINNHDGFDGDLAKFVKSGRFGIDCWVRHVNSWIHPKKEMKFHLVKYEDLHDDAFSTVKTLFTNLGLNIPDATIRTSIEYCSFDNMRNSDKLYRQNSPTRNYDFVREGKTKAELDETLKTLIKSHAKDLLEKFYPDLL
jgi:hypothetical protein